MYIQNFIKINNIQLCDEVFTAIFFCLSHFLDFAKWFFNQQLATNKDISK